MNAINLYYTRRAYSIARGPCCAVKKDSDSPGVEKVFSFSSVPMHRHLRRAATCRCDQTQRCNEIDARRHLTPDAKTQSIRYMSKSPNGAYGLMQDRHVRVVSCLLLRRLNGAIGSTSVARRMKRVHSSLSCVQSWSGAWPDATRSSNDRKAASPTSARTTTTTTTAWSRRRSISE